MRAAAEVLLKQECQFASFLGAHVLLFPTPFPLFDCNSADSAAFSSVTAATANYARCVNGALDKMPFAHIWVRIPVGLMSVDNSTTTTTTTTNTEAAWAVWNLIRTLCDHNPRLKVGKGLRGRRK